MNYPKYKTIYRIYDFYHLDIPEHNDVKLRLHGWLDFSTLEKLKEMCPWWDDEPKSVICTITSNEDNNDLDSVPDCY